MRDVLLDTSFLIRLVNESDSLHEITKGYFKYFLENKTILWCSTLSIAEYCVRGSISELPLRHIRILPFNIEHANRAGSFTNITLANRQNDLNRDIVKIDSSLFAQCEEEKIEGYITSDASSKRVFDILESADEVHFEFIDLHIPYSEQFGILELE